MSNPNIGFNPQHLESTQKPQSQTSGQGDDLDPKTGLTFEDTLSQLINEQLDQVNEDIKHAQVGRNPDGTLKAGQRADWPG